MYRFLVQCRACCFQHIFIYYLFQLSREVDSRPFTGRWAFWQLLAVFWFACPKRISLPTFGFPVVNCNPSPPSQFLDQQVQTLLGHFATIPLSTGEKEAMPNRALSLHGDPLSDKRTQQKFTGGNRRRPAHSKTTKRYPPTI